MSTTSPSRWLTSSPIPTHTSILWALTIVVLIKYAIFALEFGTIEGEGGPFAVYTALYPPPEVSLSFVSSTRNIQANALPVRRRNETTEL